MKKAKRNNILIATILFALLPVAVFAQTDTTVAAGTTDTSATPAATTPAATTPSTISVPQGFNGIFSCNQNGANAMSVGALGATGGVYVPVADATVELNTGTLVYKECVLREVVDAQRQAATAGFLQQAYNQIQTGRNGSPEYVVNPTQDELAADNQIVVDDLEGTFLDPLDPPTIEQIVKQAIAQAYTATTQNPSAQLACPYPGSTADFTSSNPSGSIWNDLLGVGSTCNPLFAYMAASDLVTGDIAQGNVNLQQEWLWGGGLYPITTGNANPLSQQIVTPSSLVNSSFTQIVNSPFNQLQNANDLGQMVGALFAGISTQITSPNGGGLAGLSQPIGNQPSYLAQAVAQTSQNLQQNISNAALSNLQAALTVEQSYFNIMASIAGTLTGSISQLRGAENQCWQQIISHVCATPVTANGTCTAAVACTTTSTNGGAGVTSCPTGGTLHVATSTAFSQAIISSQIASLASTTANNLNVSQQALNVINQLIQGVANSSSPDSQAVAIEQLNTLIVNHQLHTQPDITTAQTQQQSVQGAMTTLVQNSVSLWAGTDPNNSLNTNIAWDGSVSPGTGWCNFQNQTTLQMWEQRWSQ